MTEEVHKMNLDWLESTDNILIWVCPTCDRKVSLDYSSDKCEHKLLTRGNRHAIHKGNTSGLPSPIVKVEN
jgi:hypothetical protein